MRKKVPHRKKKGPHQYRLKSGKERETERGEGEEEGEAMRHKQQKADLFSSMS